MVGSMRRRKNFNCDTLEPAQGIEGTYRMGDGMTNRLKIVKQFNKFDCKISVMNRQGYSTFFYIPFPTISMSTQNRSNLREFRSILGHRKREIR